MLKHLILAALLLAALPSLLYAVGMGGMGMGGMSMGKMVDKVTIETEDVGAVEFSHSVHGTQCTACHPRLFKKNGENPPLSMKQMERGRSCGACHNGRKAFSVTSNCTTCHAGEIVYRDTGMGDVAFSHTAHIEMFGGCDSCHPGLFEAKRGANGATMEEMENGASCGACHDGSTAFGVAEACDACHQM